ncbi:hypothetical protein PHISCL_01925 [Aspergillus sclerotialis]|uniref:Xylanolytic transcriptional activator regulatory domain-containing protein n=1 Tax=Aspergillus sclerotialis TaxID=2070753 RepID=A0A3A2ZWG4_9EURO|nr:hypothetical protein PHISCL_01925 [Aspergillus sclerotialis]
MAPVQGRQKEYSTIDTGASARCQSEPLLNDSLCGPLPDSETPHVFPERPKPQAIQSLDLLEGLSYQVIGASGESDPWLLRHCRFDERGFLPFHRVHVRNAGGVPLDEKIPVHFLVTDDRQYSSNKDSTSFFHEQWIREKLNSLVPLEYGQRLVALFVKFIFPSLPIISRSQLGLSEMRTAPSPEALQRMPVHLLAAIYASAQPFFKFDEHLSVLNAYIPSPTEELWGLALELVLREIHTAHLSTLQAGILYLQKSTEENQSAIADSPFSWSFTGMLVGLAMSLGLYLECRPMGLPAWEKRLRRRLWWAIYAEDKWRSLLIGRPPYIRSDEWDVTDLDDDDFRMDASLADRISLPDDDSKQEILYARPFQYFVRLSRLSDEVQYNLYSLKASQRLYPNFNATLEAARPLFQQLKEWYASLPASLKQQNRSFTTIDGMVPQSSCLRFCYMLLEVFIFRALLRPMVLSATPPPLFEESEGLANFLNHVNAMTFANDSAFRTIEDEVEPVLAIDVSDQNGTGNATLKAAENCALKILRMVMQMTNRDLAEFWFPWARIGFATVSNYIMLLLVQAPTKDHAVRANRLLCLWRQALRSQSGGCALMLPALTRLDELYSTGLSRNYYLPKHVKELLDEQLH